MSYRYGKRSIEKRNQLHPKLQAIADEVIKVMDVSILTGYRGEAEQNSAYSTGKSKLKFPASKHNRMPARAMDIAPYPIDWTDIERFQYLGGLVMGIASQRGIKIKWGGQWSTLKDYPHFELED